MSGPTKELAGLVLAFCLLGIGLSIITAIMFNAVCK